MIHLACITPICSRISNLCRVRIACEIKKDGGRDDYDMGREKRDSERDGEERERVRRVLKEARRVRLIALCEWNVCSQPIGDVFRDLPDDVTYDAIHVGGAVECTFSLI